MNLEERKRIGELWVGLGSMYGKEIPRQTMTLMLNAIQDLNPLSIEKVLNEWAVKSKLGRHPLPVEIREAINPTLNSRDVANELARKIDKAVGRYGYMWASGVMGPDGFYWDGGGEKWGSFKEAVIAELGDVGWHVVCSRGGWSHVRESANEMDEGQFIAQMRDQIESTIRLKQSGVDVTKISMPSGEHKSLTGEPEKFGDVIKLLNIKNIEGKKDE